MKKRIIVILLALVISSVLFITTASAESSDYTFDSATGSMVIYTDAGIDAWTETVKVSEIKSITFKCKVNIGYEKFKECTALESVVFEDECSVGNGSFYNCVSLKNLEFAKAAKLASAAFVCEGNTTLESVTFPAGSELEIGQLFADYKALKNVTFKGKVVLEGRSFAGCSALENVRFEDESVIGGNAFQSCKSLKTLEFLKPARIKGGTFYCSENTVLKSLTFPAGTVMDKASIFANYKGLESVTFKGEIEVGASNFSGCSALKTIVFEDKSNVKEGAFANCTSLETLTFKKATKLDPSPFNCNNGNSKLKSLTFPEGSELSSAALFSNYTGLKDVTFKSDITVRASNFSGCTSLESVVFEGESFITDGAFANCVSLKNLTFKKATKIGGGAFSCSYSQNDKLESLIFPAGSLFESSGLFTKYNALKNLTFEGDAVFGGGNFSNCASLKNVTFKGKANILDTAFIGCKSLDELIFMDTVGISTTAFASSYDYSTGAVEKSTVNTIVLGAEKPDIMWFDAFSIFNTKITYKVPHDSIEEYKTALGNITSNIKGTLVYGQCIAEKPATCSEKGRMAYYKCSVCNKLYKDEDGNNEIENLEQISLPLTAHNHGAAVRENEIAATCTKAGSYDEVVYCTDCNQEISRNKKDISAIGHVESDEWQSDGTYHWKVCAADGCGEIISETKSKHSFEQISATGNGKNELVCSVCGHSEDAHPMRKFCLLKRVTAVMLCCYLHSCLYRQVLS